MIDYKRTILSNGLVVIAEQDTTTNMAVVNVLYKVGSRNESPDKTGFAHLFEHLMFGGSQHVPDFDIPIQIAGGENNAFTNNDYTNYYDLIPDQNLEVALWAEADRMLNLSITQETLDIQKKVVVEEFKEVCLNKPYGDSWHHLSALSFEKHPYRWPTIGLNTDHIELAQIQDVTDFYQSHYSPDNAVLSIVSPRDTSEIFNLAEKWFGDIPERGSIRSFPEQEPRQLSSRHKTVYGNVPLPIFMLAFHMPGRHDRDYYVCDLITEMLAGGKSSRFYQQLVKRRRLMSHVDCYITGSNDPGLIVVEGRPMEGTSIEKCLEAVWEVVEDLKAGTFTARELQKVKNKVVTSLALSDISPLNRAISMAYFEGLGLLDQMNDQEKIYELIRREVIIRASREYLIHSNMSRLDYLPGT